MAGAASGLVAQDEGTVDSKASKRGQKSASGRGWVQQRLFDIGWSDESECQACRNRLHHCSEWYEVRREIPEAFRKWEQKAKNFNEGVKVAKKYCDETSL